MEQFDWTQKYLMGVIQSMTHNLTTPLSAAPFLTKGKNKLKLYSPESFQALCDDLLYLNPANDTLSLIETVGKLTEVLVWSDKNQLPNDTTKVIDGDGKVNSKELDAANVESELKSTNYFQHFLQQNLHIYLLWLLNLSTPSQQAREFNLKGFVSWSRGSPSTLPAVTLSSDDTHASNNRSVRTRTPTNNYSFEPIDKYLVELKIQLLQTFHIWLESCHQTVNLQALLTSKFLDTIFTMPDFDPAGKSQLEEELLPYFVTFIKSVVSTLSKHSNWLLPRLEGDDSNRKVKLLDRCCQLILSKDPMVKVALKTITLNLLSVRDYNFHRSLSCPDHLPLLLTWNDELVQLPPQLDASLKSNRRPQFLSLASSLWELISYLNDLLKLSLDGPKLVLRPKIWSEVLVPTIFNLNQIDLKLHLLTINLWVFTFEDVVLTNLLIQRMFHLDPNLLEVGNQQLPSPQSELSTAGSPETKDTTEDEDNQFETRIVMSFFNNRLQLYRDARYDMFDGLDNPAQLLDKFIVKLDNQPKLGLPVYNRRVSMADVTPSTSIIRRSTNSTQSLPDLNGQFDFESYRNQMDLATQLLQVVLLMHCLAKQKDLLPQWQLKLGISNQRQVRMWLLTHELLVSNDKSKQERVNAEDEEQRQQLFNILNPELVYDQNIYPWWYQRYTIKKLFEVLDRHVQLPLVTLKLVGDLLIDLLHFPGTKPCLEPNLAQIITTRLDRFKGQFIQLLTTSPKSLDTIGLVKKVADHFLGWPDTLQQQLLFRDAIQLVQPTTLPTPPPNHNPTVDQLSRITFLTLLYLKLSHWLLRTNPSPGTLINRSYLPSSRSTSPTNLLPTTTFKVKAMDKVGTSTTTATLHLHLEEYLTSLQLTTAKKSNQVTTKLGPITGLKLTSNREDPTTLVVTQLNWYVPNLVQLDHIHSSFLISNSAHQSQLKFESEHKLTAFVDLITEENIKSKEAFLRRISNAFN